MQGASDDYDHYEAFKARNVKWRGKRMAQVNANKSRYLDSAINIPPVARIVQNRRDGRREDEASHSRLHSRL
jgi:hypothetical protein